VVNERAYQFEWDEVKPVVIKSQLISDRKATQSERGNTKKDYEQRR